MQKILAATEKQPDRQPYLPHPFFSKAAAAR